MNNARFLGMLVCPYGHAMHAEGRESECPACSGDVQMPLLTLNERWEARIALLRELDDDPPPGLMTSDDEREELAGNADQDDSPPPGLCADETVDEVIASLYGQAMLDWAMQAMGDAPTVSVESR